MSGSSQLIKQSEYGDRFDEWRKQRESEGRASASGGLSSSGSSTSQASDKSGSTSN
jgi:hypothetical protein